VTTYNVHMTKRYNIEADSGSDAIDIAEVASTNPIDLEGVEFEGSQASIVPDDGPLNGVHMTFDEWAHYGWRHGWCSPVVCETHDGLPMSDDEASEDEPCLHLIRVYESPEHKAAIEADHAPASWRASNQGWKA